MRAVARLPLFREEVYPRKPVRVEKYGLSLIRLSTRGSDEEKKIRDALNKVTIV